MVKDGNQPDHVTFGLVLSACSHAGLLTEAKDIFRRMQTDFGLLPNIQHYNCMVDVLSRAGHLDEAQQLVANMNCEPDEVTLTTLLGACRIRKDIKRAEKIAWKLVELYPKFSGSYVLLSNMYAATGQRDKQEKVLKMMKDQGVKKVPGRSWTEVGGQTHYFYANDTLHPQAAEIYAQAERQWKMLLELGHLPDTSFVLHDVAEEQKKHLLCYHSEKLAIAFAHLSLPPGQVIRIAKNLRVCGDCHAATKGLSIVLNRKIIVRDANRFHHFENGKCSCNDYW
jgi:pentatricopeptide repeat protein